MSETTNAPIVLPEVEVVGERTAPPSPPRAGRADHDPDYENRPPPPAPPGTSAPKAPKRPDDTVTLIVAGQPFTGWTDVRISRGIEVFPSFFVLALTEKNPSSPNLLSIDPGQKCQVKIGSELVLTGFIDKYRSTVTPAGHRVVVTGRSATEDLVDCAAGVFPGQERSAVMTVSAVDFLHFAQHLAAPFGITVTEPDGEGAPLVSLGTGIPALTIPLGATPYDVMEPIARWRQRILLDGPNGELIIAAVGTTKAASGFFLPGNVEAAEVEFSKDHRYTIYLPALNSTDPAYDVASAAGTGSANYLNPVADDAAFKDQPRWDGQPRYRPTFVISDQGTAAITLAEYRAQWQKGRDYGRSQAVTATVSLWRDSAGTLWAPNTLATVDMPILKLKGLTWIISKVEFRRGADGTRSVVTLMPKEAFVPEPSLFTPYDPQIAQALETAVRQEQDRGTHTPGNPAFNPRRSLPPGSGGLSLGGTEGPGV